MNSPESTQEIEHRMLQVDPVLEFGIKEMIREVVKKKAKSIITTRTDDFVNELYIVIKRVAVADELTEEQFNKMQATMMDGLGRVYFDGMDFHTLTLDKVHEFQDELIEVVAECMQTVEEFLKKEGQLQNDKDENLQLHHLS